MKNEMCVCWGVRWMKTEKLHTKTAQPDFNRGGPGDEENVIELREGKTRSKEQLSIDKITSV